MRNFKARIIKLLKSDYITGNPNEGYFAAIPPDYPDDTDD